MALSLRSSGLAKLMRLSAACRAYLIACQCRSSTEPFWSRPQQHPPRRGHSSQLDLPSPSWTSCSDLQPKKSETLPESPVVKDVIMSFPFFTTKAVVASGLESGMPSLDGPPW